MKSINCEKKISEAEYVISTKNPDSIKIEPE